MDSNNFCAQDNSECNHNCPIKFDVHGIVEACLSYGTVELLTDCLMETGRAMMSQAQDYPLRSTNLRNLYMSTKQYFYLVSYAHDEP